MWSIILRHPVFRRKSTEQIIRSFAPPPSLLRKYEHFQKDNGIPVYIKGGITDKVLIALTLAGIAIGLSDGLFTLFTMAKPKKK